MTRPAEPALDAALLRHTFASFPSGVTAVCAMAGSGPTGMAVSSFTSVSLEPPLVSMCVANTSATWAAMRALPSLGVSVLSTGQGEACRRLSAKNADRFAGTEWEQLPGGAIVLGGAAAWFECRVESELPAGDHHIVLLRILGLHSEPGVTPLVFHESRFRALAA